MIQPIPLDSAGRGVYDANRPAPDAESADVKGVAVSASATMQSLVENGMDDRSLIRPARTHGFDRWLIGVVAIVALVAIAVGTYAYHQHQEAVAREKASRSAASDKAKKFAYLSSRVTELAGDLYAAEDAYDKHWNAATDVSKERHNAGVAENLDNETGLELARKEVQGVEAAENDAHSMTDRLTQIADTIGAQYGEQSIRQLRSDTERFDTGEQIALSKWSRAASDIEDSFQEQLNGGWGITGNEVEQLYDDSTDEDTRATAALKSAHRDVATLQSRLATDGTHAKADLAALR